MEAVQSITFRTSKGELKEFKCLADKKANKDSAVNIVVKDDQGKESIYTKELIKDKDGNESYVYVHCNGGEHVTPHKKELPKDKNYFWTLGDCGWDRDVDKFFDGVLGIDNSKATTDGKDDGHLTWGEIGKHTLKGALSPVKAIVKSPVKSAIIAGVAAAACVAFPPLGLALSAIGLIGGLATLGIGAYKAAKAKSDSEAKSAWENVGSGTVTAILSAIGLRKFKKGLDARAELSHPTPAPAPAPGPSAPAPTPGDYEYSGLAKMAIKATDSVKQAADTVTTSAKELGSTIAHPVRTWQKYDLPSSPLENLRSNGFGEYANWKLTQLGRHRVGLSINDCANNVSTAIQNGNHWQAKQALSELSHVISKSGLEGDALTSAKNIYAACSKTIDATRYINKFPAYRATVLGQGLVENATDDSATALYEASKNAYSFAS